MRTNGLQPNFKEPRDTPFEAHFRGSHSVHEGPSTVRLNSPFHSTIIVSLLACAVLSIGNLGEATGSAAPAPFGDATAASTMNRSFESLDQSTTTTTATPTNNPPTSAAPSTSTTTSTTLDACPQNLAARIVLPTSVEQLITVEVPRPRADVGAIIAWQRRGACWAIAHGPFKATLAYRGVSTRKREGDDTTPAGIFKLGPTIYGTSSNPGVKFAYHRLVCGDWWDEDSVSREYNLFEHVACAVNPAFNNGSSEALWTETNSYQSFAVLEYNLSRTPGLGSAIFLHAYDGAPTTGCVSTPLTDLDAILDWLNHVGNPRIVIGTIGTITKY